MLLGEVPVLVHCLKIFDEKIAPQAKFMKQIARQARFF